jgi:hypothetical protein
MVNWKTPVEVAILVLLFFHARKYIANIFSSKKRREAIILTIENPSTLPLYSELCL